MAGQAAVKEHAQKVLEKGWTIGLISVGTLADSEFFSQLKQTAEQHDAHLHLLAGAIAGIDGISAAKEGGLEKVTYKGCKSPKSWRGSYAEQLVDLDQVSEAMVFFSWYSQRSSTEVSSQCQCCSNHCTRRFRHG